MCTLDRTKCWSIHHKLRVAAMTKGDRCFIVSQTNADAGTDKGCSSCPRASYPLVRFARIPRAWRRHVPTRLSCIIQQTTDPPPWNTPDREYLGRVAVLRTAVSINFLADTGAVGSLSPAPRARRFDPFSRVSLAIQSYLVPIEDKHARLPCETPG